MAPSELFDAFRLEVDDLADGTLWSEDEIYRYMDQAQREFARKTDCFLDATTASVTQIAITANQALVTLSPLVTKVRRGELASNFNTVKATTLAEMDEGAVIGSDYGRVVPTQWRSATGEPRWAVTDYQPGKLLLVPKPVIADTLSLAVFRLPLNTLTSSSTVLEVIDEDHQYGLRLFMEHLAYLKQDAETYNPKRSKNAKDEWAEFIADAKRSFRRKRYTPKAIAYGGI